MSERAFFDGFLRVWLGLAAMVFAALLVTSAPYGRHSRRGWGPRLPFAVGWAVMEAPAVLGMLALFALGDQRGAVALVLLGLWQLHYLNRAFVYAARRRRVARPFPATVVVLGFVFNLGNAYLNGRWLFALGPEYSPAWLIDPRFVLGSALFIGGFGINLHADAVLRALRKPGETGYHVPRGGLYRWVSCPNYLGEIVEWLGWAVLTWSLPGLVFAAWTAANLGPRALANHRWYRERFPDYPPERRALIPFVL